MRAGYFLVSSQGGLTRLSAALLALSVLAVPVALVSMDMTHWRWAEAGETLLVPRIRADAPRIDTVSSATDRGRAPAGRAYPVRFGFFREVDIEGDGSAGDEAGKSEKQVTFRVVSGDEEEEMLAAVHHAEDSAVPSGVDHSARTFAEAFSDLAMPEHSLSDRKVLSDQTGLSDRKTLAEKPVPALGSPAGILTVSYDIGGASRLPANALSIDKALVVNGKPHGKVALRIVNDTTILVRQSQVASALGNLEPFKRVLDDSNRRSTEGFVDFDDLRAVGLDIRYDPIRDTVHIAATPP